MVVDVLKARLGMGGRGRRYTDIESVRDLEEISDPETSDNESKETIRDTWDKHPYAFVLGSVVALIATGLFIMYTARLAPGVLTNKWTWIGIAVATYTGFIYKRGWRARDSNVTKYDELTLKENADQTTYKGTFVDLGGRAPAFIPIKGWDRWGHQAKPYLNADLGGAMVETFQRHKMQDDQAAVIRLQPGERGELLSQTDTEWGGKRITQETSGLKPDAKGNQTSLMATYPDFEDERANSLAMQLEQVTSDYYDAVEEVESLSRRVWNLKDRLNEPIEDEVDSRIEQFERLGVAAGGRQSTAARGSPHQQDDWQGTGFVQANGQAQNEVTQVEEELSNDDD